MLKETVNYTDYNDVTRTEVLYFNINQSELMDNLNLREDLEKIQASLEGPERQLTTEEVQQILDLVKRMMKLAYGRRSDDGLNFRKTEQIWDDFASSAVYDAFIMSLFKNPEKAFEFLVACMPKELMEQARQEMGENVVELPQPAGNVFENSPAPEKDATGEPKAPEPERMAMDLDRDWHEYSEEDLLGMPQEAFEKLYNKIKGPKPTLLVSIAMRRRAQGS
jgi:hypothetical protein